MISTGGIITNHSLASLAAPAPSHNVRVWYASYMTICTGLPKTGTTNQNAPHLLVNQRIFVPVTSEK